MRSMFTILAVSAALVLTSPAWATKPLSNDQLASMARVIRLADYECGTANDGWFRDKVERGLRFRVMCDGDRFRYTVILTPSNRFIVSTD